MITLKAVTTEKAVKLIDVDNTLVFQTGRNENTETYYEFILSKTKAETLAELEKINIKESDIV